jgi:putative glycosyltransferase
MQLSIITTLYYSSPYITYFYERITKAVQPITESYEIIFVNDGSPDDSLEKAKKLHSQDPKVKIIDLSRNFGHHKAMMTGLAHTKGEYVFLIDSDLEEEPELIGLFWQELNKQPETDVIYGVQLKRKGKIFEKISGALFYKIFNLFSTIKIPENIFTARLMKKKYVESLVNFKEHELFIMGAWSATGFVQKPVYIQKHSHSPSTYSFSKKVGLLVNAITAFSSKPLVYVFYLGSTISIISFLAIIYIIYRKIIWGISVIGWASLIASIWMIGGLIMLSIGIVGIYMSKIFNEVKDRPYTIIKNIYE